MFLYSFSYVWTKACPIPFTSAIYKFSNTGVIVLPYCHLVDLKQGQSHIFYHRLEQGNTTKIDIMKQAGWITDVKACEGKIIIYRANNFFVSICFLS